MRPLGPGKCDHHEMNITDGCLYVLGNTRRAGVSPRPASKLYVSSLLNLLTVSLAVLQVCQMSIGGSDDQFTFVAVVCDAHGTHSLDRLSLPGF